MEDLDVRRFDETMFEKYYTRKETIKFKETTKKGITGLLDKVQTLIKADSKTEPMIPRKFVKPNNGSAATTSTELPRLRVMQWNILAQGLSTGKDNFSRCPNSALVWERRRLRILEEIFTVNPDVICMQEVDHYGLFQPLLATVGYQGVFYPKPDSPALYTAHSNGPDGCAIFYKNKKLKLISKDCIVLKAGHKCTNQVSVIVTLQPKGSNKLVTIATTHLKAMKGYDTLRQKQGSYLLDYLRHVAADNALVVTGDFNAPESEPVIQTYLNSDLKLSSAYQSVPGGPDYTTWTYRGGWSDGEEEVKSTLDYIWYQRDRVAVTEVSEIPTEDVIGETGIPSNKYPSDHFSLTADLVLL